MVSSRWFVVMLAPFRARLPSRGLPHLDTTSEKTIEPSDNNKHSHSEKEE